MGDPVNRGWRRSLVQQKNLNKCPAQVKSKGGKHCICFVAVFFLCLFIGAFSMTSSHFNMFRNAFAQHEI